MSEEMIRVARERVAGIDAGMENVEFELADAMRWEFPREHFDFVCSVATLHHLEQREILIKIRDALRPGGVLVVLDLVESSGVKDRVMDVVGLGVSTTLRLVRNGRLRPPPEVRKAWEQHGKHDHYATVRQVRTLADEILPGAVVKRRLLWRYELVYRKPAAD